MVYNDIISYSKAQSHAYQSWQPLRLLYLSRLQALLYISDQQGSVRGDRGMLHIKRGDRRECGPDGGDGRGLSGWEAGRPAGTVGGRTETEKIFSSSRGCAFLQRVVSGRDGG